MLVTLYYSGSYQIWPEKICRSGRRDNNAVILMAMRCSKSLWILLGFLIQQDPGIADHA